MQIDVNGTRLWFDVAGMSLVPDGRQMNQRPTVILVHGGPGGFDHSYFKPDFEPLTSVAQVVYLDLRDHGRSARHDPADWSYEICADDIRAFADALGIRRPVVYGHSMGGFITLAYGIRHPGHAAGLVIQSAHARYDLARLKEGFRRVAGDEVAALAERDYAGDSVTDDEWARVFAAFGTPPDDDQMARRIRNPAVNPRGNACFREFDVTDQLGRIGSPMLVCVGEHDPVTPVEASEEIVGALPAGIGRLEVIEGAGHFPWRDAPDRYWPVITSFVAATWDQQAVQPSASRSATTPK